MNALIIVYVIFSEVFYHSSGLHVSECGGVLSKELEGACANTMINRSFIGSNFGEDFEEKFNPYQHDYYRPELINSDAIIECINNLNSPNVSPNTKMNNIADVLSKFNKEDVTRTNADNIRDWCKNSSTHFEDNVAFHLDNTSVSRDDIF